MKFTQAFLNVPANGLVLGALLFLGAIAWLLWNRLLRIRVKRGAISEAYPPPDANTGTTAETESLTNTGTRLQPVLIEPRKGSFPSLPLNHIAVEVASTEIKEFLYGVVARIRKEEPILEIDLSFSFIEEVVDRIDDLAIIKRKADSDDAAKIEQFVACLTELLRCAGIELLHSESWNPELQRALSKTPRPGILEPTIESYGSTGFTQHSKLIRKQEVMLTIPQPN